MEKISIPVTVANATAERDETGKTISELIQMIGAGSNANLGIRLTDPALFGQIHPNQKFVLEISPAAPEAEGSDDGKKDDAEAEGSDDGKKDDAEA